jgi:hypothetical protein
MPDQNQILKLFRIPFIVVSIRKAASIRRILGLLFIIGLSIDGGGVSMAEFEAFIIFGGPILLIGGLLYLMFRSGGWFNRVKEENITNIRFTKFGYLIFSIAALIVFGGISFGYIAPDTLIGRFMSDSQRLYRWGCYLVFALAIFLCEIKGYAVFKKK